MLWYAKISVKNLFILVPGYVSLVLLISCVKALKVQVAIGWKHEVSLKLVRDSQELLLFGI